MIVCLVKLNLDIRYILKGWSVHIGSGNDLVSSGNKPLPEPYMTKFYNIIRRQWNEFFFLQISLNFIPKLLLAIS